MSKWTCIFIVSREGESTWSSLDTHVFGREREREGGKKRGRRRRKGRREGERELLKGHLLIKADNPSNTYPNQFLDVIFGERPLYIEFILGIQHSSFHLLACAEQAGAHNQCVCFERLC